MTLKATSLISSYWLISKYGDERRCGKETKFEIDKRPHYFAFQLQKSAIGFHRTLADAQKCSYDETVKAFRTHYTEKRVVFRGCLASRIQHPGEKLTNFWGDFQGLAMKAYPGESNEIRDHLVVAFWKGSKTVKLDLF